LKLLVSGRRFPSFPLILFLRFSRCLVPGLRKKAPCLPLLASFQYVPSMFRDSMEASTISWRIKSYLVVVPFFSFLPFLTGNSSSSRVFIEDGLAFFFEHFWTLGFPPELNDRKGAEKESSPPDLFVASQDFFFICPVDLSN